MPPAVALSNYISCGILWRIFCRTGIFPGFSLYIIKNAVRISEAALGGAGDIIFIMLTPNEQKSHGPLEKPLRMTDMRITLICMSVIQQTVKTKKT
jgi:hypothetical protein